MGKRKVIKKTEAAILEEKDKVESAIDKATKSASEGTSSRKTENGRVYINASYNNTIISITDKNGNVLASASAGSLGFSGAKKATPFAASKIVVTVFEKIKKIGLANVEIIIKGTGSGRDSAVRSIANQGVNILSIKDVTPIPHNGPRPRKARRV